MDPSRSNPSTLAASEGLGWRSVVALALTLVVSACAKSGDAPPPGPPTSPLLHPPIARGDTMQSPRTVEFRHARSRIVAGSGAPNHRGRDLLVAGGDPQILEAKFAYGVVDKDLKDEDIAVERELESDRWELVAIARTSVDGPNDDGGRVRLPVPADKTFALGTHRVRATVMGDGTRAELTVVVVPRGQAIFVSDVDGTLTESEIAEFPALAAGTLPGAHPGAAAVFQKLAARSYVPVYLTARPEWLVARTRAFLSERGFPPGVLITRRDKSGGYGASAAAFKRGELERLAAAFHIEWAFGNMPSDADAYSTTVGDPKRRVLFRQDDAARRTRRIEAYDELLPEIDAR